MKKLTRRYFIFGGLAALACAGGYSFSLWRKFGSLPETPVVSPNWHGGAFRNPPDKYVNPNLAGEPQPKGGWLKFFLDRDDNRYPPGPVSAVKSDLKSLEDGEFVWLGHSSFLLKLGGRIFCVDPVLSSRASPVPFTIPAWPGSNPFTASDFPEIDYLCITHDHWDHLDYKAVRKLKYKNAICGKGVGAHFRAWGLPEPIELDWGEEWADVPIKIVFTPSRHFSGRGLTRNQSLWGGFVLDAGNGGRVCFTGDGGYGSHFREIGEKFGPFAMVFPDSGQYNRAWADVHMFPEEAVQACLDTKAARACPAHHGKFTLAWHGWDEPVRRFARAAEGRGLVFVAPAIGEKCRIRQG